ncbi:hypothetical protein [Deminuibacter soli]|uniref:Uncharacterized protein n=1 Tax=Deminuibacter soli TaxID=2291815 RepID=A0A3E1NRK5_9BACT|nr:hypothetical protein [Deminuibacter soli]RFM30530.1 hypothetical protein DXN05_06135 [Deminuibacter soli]
MRKIILSILTDSADGQPPYQGLDWRLAEQEINRHAGDLFCTIPGIVFSKLPPGQRIPHWQGAVNSFVQKISGSIQRVTGKQAIQLGPVTIQAARPGAQATVVQLVLINGRQVTIHPVLEEEHTATASSTHELQLVKTRTFESGVLLLYTRTQVAV